MVPSRAPPAAREAPSGLCLRHTSEALALCRVGFAVAVTVTVAALCQYSIVQYNTVRSSAQCCPARRRADQNKTERSIAELRRIRYSAGKGIAGQRRARAGRRERSAAVCGAAKPSGLRRCAEGAPRSRLCGLRGEPSLAPSCAGGPGVHDAPGPVLIGLEFGMEMLKIARIIKIIQKIPRIVF